jgi:PleD family two-component response regulator
LCSFFALAASPYLHAAIEALMARSTRALCSELRRILVVHDEPRMRTLVLRALAATNDVVETKEARRAIALMRSGNHFDVVVVTCVARKGRPRYGPASG